MARTPAQAASLEKKALGAASKSQGMRDLLEAGYTVLEVQDVFDAPYGFVYGVAVRGSFVTPTPRADKPATTMAKAAKPAAKVASTTAVKRGRGRPRKVEVPVKAARPAAAPVRSKGAIRAAARRAAAKAARA
jgi:hypothetical protein